MAPGTDRRLVLKHQSATRDPSDGGPATVSLLRGPWLDAGQLVRESGAQARQSPSPPSRGTRTFPDLKKTELVLRMVWHRNPERIRSLLFLGVLAFHRVHMLRRQLAHDPRQAGRAGRGLQTVGGRLIENRQDTPRGRKRRGSHGQSESSRDCIASASRTANFTHESAQSVVPSALVQSV